MNNKIVCVTKTEADEIRTKYMFNDNVFFAEINGAEIRNEEEYVESMSSAFEFPYKMPDMKMGWYNDYICDLMWINQKDIVLLMRNFELMFADAPEIKKVVLDDFQEVILPWWDGEVIGHMVGGEPRRFMIYLERK